MSAASLAGKVAVIGGGAGDVSEGLTRAFLEAGATVVAPSRGREAGGAPPRFDDAELARVRNRTLEQHGRIGAVVASLGGWWNGKPLVDTDPAKWSRPIEGGLLSHLAMVRTFLPSIAQGGSYTLINGAAALSPVQGSAAVSVLAAAQLMLARADRGDRSERPRRAVDQLVVSSIVATRARPTRSAPVSSA